jgi:hypothetical protein
MALPLRVYGSCDVLQPEEVGQHDPLLLQPRTTYYEYVSSTARARWQLDQHVENDLVQLECQHARQTVSTRLSLVTDSVQNDLASRVSYAGNCDREARAEEARQTTQSSRQSAPLGFLLMGNAILLTSRHRLLRSFLLGSVSRLDSWQMPIMTALQLPQVIRLSFIGRSRYLLL